MVVIKIYANDFEYDGVRLQNLGYMICSFDGGGLQTSSSGSQITINTVSMKQGESWGTVSSEYTECLQATFSICKIPCMHENIDISLLELRQLMRWLNRKSYHKFRFIDSDYNQYYFNASFNVNKIEFGNSIIGLELTMQTDLPYAFGRDKKHILESEEENWEVEIINSSDIEGFVYPEMVIEIKSSGDFILKNSMDEQTMEIKNCQAGEIITLNYPLISSSIPSHKIQNDFNWHFLRLGRIYKDGKNSLNISLPSKIKIFYIPAIKLGI